MIAKVEKQKIKICNTEHIVSGSQEIYKVKFEFDEEWAEYTPTAVFKHGGAAYQILLTNDECVIPSEVLTNKGYLRIGVFGENGFKRYPTIWADPITVDLGVCDGEIPSEPTPDVYSQILEELEEKIPKSDISTAEDYQAIIDNYEEEA